MGTTATSARSFEAIADLDALDRLDTHHRGSELAVEAVVAADERSQADRQTDRDRFDDAAQGVAVFLGRFDLGDHRRLGGLVECPHRAVVDRRQVAGLRWRTVIRRGIADRDDMGDHLDAEGLAEELPGDGTGRDAGGGLTGAGALQDRAGVVEFVLEHAGVVGVAGPRPGQRRIARPVQLAFVHRVGGHHGFPLGPFGVADLDGDRTAECDAMPYPGQDGDLVALELHPGPAAVAEPPAGQLVGDVVGGDGQPGDHAFDHSHQRSAVGFTSSCPSQHGSHLPTPRPDS